MFDRKTPFLAALVMVGALCAGSAHASRVNWSVSVNVPVPVAPVHYQPAPVYYQPAPAYVQPAPVYYQPSPVVVYRPGYRVVEGGGDYYRHGHRHHRHHRHEWREQRDEYGDYHSSRGRR